MSNPYIDDLDAFMGGGPSAPSVSSQSVSKASSSNPYVADLDSFMGGESHPKEEEPSFLTKAGSLATRIGGPIAGGLIGAALGGPPGAVAGAVIGGGLGEAGGEKIEGRPLDPVEIGLSAALSGLPAGPAARLAEQGGRSLLARGALHALEGATQGAIGETVHAGVREGRLPTAEELGRGAASGGVLGAALSLPFEAARARGGVPERAPVGAPDVWKGEPPPDFIPTPAEPAAGPEAPPVWNGAPVEPEQPAAFRSPEEVRADVLGEQLKQRQAEADQALLARVQRERTAVEAAKSATPVEEQFSKTEAPTDPTILNALAGGRSGERRAEHVPVEQDRRVVDRREQLAQDLGLPSEHPAVDRVIDAENKANQDGLTGLLNKAAHDRDAPQAIGKGHVSLDVSGLKAVNDTYGHPVGDAFLKDVADEMQRVADDHGASLYRVGGDEFAAITPNADTARNYGRAVKAALADKQIVARGHDDKVLATFPGARVDFGYEGGGQASFTDADKALLEYRKRAEASGDRVPYRSARIDGGAEGGGLPAVGERPTAGSEVDSAGEPAQALIPPEPVKGNEGEGGAPAAAPEPQAPAFRIGKGGEPVSEIQTQHVERAFPGREVSQGEDGAWSVGLQNGRKIRVQSDGSIELDPVALAKGRPGTVPEDVRAVGSYQRVGLDGLIRLAKQGGDETTLGHEVFHAAMDMTLTPKEKAAVLKRYGGEEAAADAYAKWKPDEPHGVFPRIAAFFKRIWNAWKPDADAVFGRVKSGEAWGTPHPETGRKFSSTQVDLPASIGDRMRALAAKIPDKDLSVDPNGAGREADPHVTVKFGLHTNDAEAVRGALAGEGPVKVRLGDTSTFPAKPGVGYDVVKADIDSPDLHRLNEKLARAVPATDTHPTYEAHATIAYVKPGLGEKYSGDSSLRGAEATVRELTLSTRDGKEVLIPLKGSEPKYATAAKYPPGMEEAPAEEPARPSATEPEHPIVESNVRKLRDTEGETLGAKPAELARDEPKTNADTLEEARTLGSRWTDADFYRQMKKGQLDAAETVAWRNRVDQKATIRSAAQDALDAARSAGKDTKALQEDYANKSLDYLKALSAHVEQGTEQGRALQARSILDKFDAKSPEAVGAKLLRAGLPEDAVGPVVEAIHHGDPQEINQALVKAFKPSTSDKLHEAWINGLLSAPGTTIAKSVSDLLSLVGTGVERGAAGLADAARTKWTNGPQERQAGEMWAHFRGMRQGLDEALTNARKAWNEEPTGFDAGVMDNPRAPYAIEGKLGKVIRAGYGGGGSRALRAVDSFSKTLARYSEQHVQALRIAAEEGGSRADVAARAEQIANTPAAELPKLIGAKRAAEVQDAMDSFMKRATFTTDFGPMMMDVQRFRNKHALARIVMPFMKVPWNLAVEGYKGTPLNFINIAQKMRTGELNGGALSDALVRPILGTGIMATVGLMAADGQLTGSGPEDPNARKAWMSAGNQPYSVKVPGAGWVSYKKLEPWATIIGLAANVAEMKDERKGSEMARKAVGALGEAFTQKTFLTGLEQVGGILRDPIQYAGGFVGQLEGSVVPNIVAKAAQAIDPTVRDTTIKGGVAAPIEARIPGLTKLAPSKEGLAGEDLERGGTAAERFASPFARSPEPSKYADLETEMARIGYAPSAPKREITIQGRKVQLTDQEYDKLLTARDKAAQQASRVISMPAYKAAPESPVDVKLGSQQKAKESYIKHYFERADQEFRARYGMAILRRSRADGAS